MTAPTPPLVDVIAEVLAEHTLHYIVPADMNPAPGSKWHVECDCDWTHLADEYRPGEIAHAAHQARAVLAAISEAGTVEWGVRWAGDARQNARRPTRCDSAQEAAELVRDQVIPHMWEVVSRLTFPWKRAE